MMDGLPRFLRRSATDAGLAVFSSEPVRKSILLARELVALARATKPIIIDDLPEHIDKLEP